LTIAPPACGLLVHHERAPDVGAQHPVKDTEIAAKKDFVAAWGEARAEINVQENTLTRQLREQRIVPQPIPEAMLRVLREGRGRGELAGSVDPQAAAEIVAGLYFDTEPLAGQRRAGV